MSDFNLPINLLPSHKQNSSFWEKSTYIKLFSFDIHCEKIGSGIDNTRYQDTFWS